MCQKKYKRKQTEQFIWEEQDLISFFLFLYCSFCDPLFLSLPLFVIIDNKQYSSFICKCKSIDSFIILFL